jgi:hypothetical protein
MNEEDALTKLKEIFGDDLQFKITRESFEGKKIIEFLDLSAFKNTLSNENPSFIAIDNNTGKLHKFHVTGPHLDKMFSCQGLDFTDFAKQFMAHYKIAKLEPTSGFNEDYSYYGARDLNVKILLITKKDNSPSKAISLEKIIKAGF